MSSNPQAPGLDLQPRVRFFLRVVGAALLVVGAGFMVIGLMDFFASMDSFQGPTKFWMLFAGMPMLFLGGAFSMYGWIGAGSRYVAGETMPVVRDSVGYLSGGHAAGPTHGDASAAGPFCRGCGTRNDETAKFCDYCGQSLA